MRAVNVGVHRRKPVRETFGDEALRSEVVTLVEPVLAKNIEDGGIAFETCGMEGQSFEQVLDPGEAPRWIFKGDSPYQTVHLIAQGEQVFGEVAAVLSGDPGNQGLLHKLKSGYC